MNSLQHFSEQLKKAQLRRQSNQANQVTTKVSTSAVTTNTSTTKTIKLTDDQYRNILVAKAVTYIKGRA